MRILNQRDTLRLTKILEKDDSFENRLKSHILILFDKYFTFDSIQKAYNVEHVYVSYIIQYYLYFGLNQLLELDFLNIQKKVNEETFRREQEKLNRKNAKFSLFSIILWPLISAISFLFYISDMIGYLIALIISLFTFLKRSNYSKKNTAIIEKGASNNYIIQINEINLSADNPNVEKLVLNDKEEVISLVETLIKSNKEFDLGNSNANKLFDKAQRVNKDDSIDSKEKDQKIKFYAFLVVAILLYGTTFKGGISSITIMGVSVVIAIRACMPVDGEVLNTLPKGNANSPVVEKIDSAYVDSMAIFSQIDSNRVLEEKVVNNINEYAVLVPNWFYPDLECVLLSSIGKKQRQFINEIDFVDHESQPYFIDYSDEKYYIHVVAYKDIREAAFQMHHINQKSQFKSSILEVSTNRGLLYFVVIGKFDGKDGSKMAELINLWENECFSTGVQIGCYYNG